MNYDDSATSRTTRYPRLPAVRLRGRPLRPRHRARALRRARLRRGDRALDGEGPLGFAGSVNFYGYATRGIRQSDRSGRSWSRCGDRAAGRPDVRHARGVDPATKPDANDLRFERGQNPRASRFCADQGFEGQERGSRSSRDVTSSSSTWIRCSVSCPATTRTGLSTTARATPVAICAGATLASSTAISCRRRRPSESSSDPCVRGSTKSERTVPCSVHEGSRTSARPSSS